MYHLVCVHAFGKYERGQTVTDPAEIESLGDRDHQFVRITVPDPEPAPEEAKSPLPEIEYTSTPPALPKK
jgi:hypothetical protein